MNTDRHMVEALAAKRAGKLTDAEKLRTLAEWFDTEQSQGRWRWDGCEVQDDLRRIADEIERSQCDAGRRTETFYVTLDAIREMDGRLNHDREFMFPTIYKKAEGVFCIPVKFSWDAPEATDG